MKLLRYIIEFVVDQLFNILLFSKENQFRKSVQGMGAIAPKAFRWQCYTDEVVLSKSDLKFG